VGSMGQIESVFSVLDSQFSVLCLGTRMGSDGVLMLGHSKGGLKKLGVESRSHHHMTQRRGLSGMAQTCRRQATTMLG
jgi:hypothetical protein